MCFFRRIVYAQCAHAYPSDPSPALKCATQRSYERGEPGLQPCSRIGAHSYASLRVSGRCRRCARADGALARIREGLLLARLRLGMDVPGLDDEFEDDNKEGSEGDHCFEERRFRGGKGLGSEDEVFSPVALTFSPLVRNEPRMLSSTCR